MNAAPEELLLSLSPSSTLLLLLRALYRLLLDYGVLWPDGAEHAFVFRKDQLVALIERGQSEALVRDLPRLAEEGLIRPVSIDEALDEAQNEDPGENPDEDKAVRALLVERRGARVLPLAKAVAPWEPEFPEWWEAPLPFALCARGRIRINRTASLMFGPDLERLNAAELPEKDEFIVELEGREEPCFLAFRRLDPDIFILEDCTGDLLEAQDISWWAGLGRAWVASLEKEGRTWRREETPPEGFAGQAWSCEWDGRQLGWLCVEPAAPESPPEPDGVPEAEAEKPEASEREPEPAPEPPLRRKPRARRSAPKREDEVLKAIGPQTMGLLAPGRVLDEPGEGSGSSGEGQPAARRAGERTRGRTP
mgnify:FL=1